MSDVCMPREACETLMSRKTRSTVHTDCHNRCKQSHGDCWGSFKVSRLPRHLHRSCNAAMRTWFLSHLYPGCVGNGCVSQRSFLLSRVSDILPLWPHFGDKHKPSEQSKGLHSWQAISSRAPVNIKQDNQVIFNHPLWPLHRDAISGHQDLSDLWCLTVPGSRAATPAEVCS